VLIYLCGSILPTIFLSLLSRVFWPRAIVIISYEKIHSEKAEHNNYVEKYFVTSSTIDVIE
jgi:uncharacterized membrane protein